jgi:hypothetical protein
MPDKPRFTSSPEKTLQNNHIVPFLEVHGWLVEVMHASYALKGIPDLYCWHQGLVTFRWIDVKLPKGSDLTKAQCQKWTDWEKRDLGIWIMKEASEEEYLKLFEPPNWREMWRPRHEKYVRDVKEILDELDDC